MAFQVESISSHVRIVLKGCPFGPKLFISFLSKKKVMAQKRSREMGNFWSTCPKHQFSEYHDLGILCFWSLKRFGRLEAVASLDAYQITKYQFFQKLVIFCVAWFPKNLINKFLSQEFHGQLKEQAWSKGSLGFSKSCPSEHHFFF